MKAMTFPPKLQNCVTWNWALRSLEFSNLEVPAQHHCGASKSGQICKGRGKNGHLLPTNSKLSPNFLSIDVGPPQSCLWLCRHPEFCPPAPDLRWKMFQGEYLLPWPTVLWVGLCLDRKLWRSWAFEPSFPSLKKKAYSNQDFPFCTHQYKKMGTTICHRKLQKELCIIGLWHQC